MRAVLIVSLLVAGCPQTTEKDDTALACEDDEGVATGTVTVEGSVVEGVTVTLTNADGSESLQPTVTEGEWSACLSAGAWSATARAADCVDSELLKVTAGEEVVVDLDVPNDCDTTDADKPNLYLYPDRPTATEVTVETTAAQRIFASEPKYRGGWRGVALPGGRFVTAAGPAPFLFYEVTLEPWQVRRFQREAGWCVAGGPEEALPAMTGILEAYGFTAAEVDDFEEGWRYDLPPAEAWAIYPQRDVEFAAGLTITPSLPVERLWLVVDDGAGCDLPEPVVLPFDRSGPHAVEWGVVLDRIAR